MSTPISSVSRYINLQPIHAVQAALDLNQQLNNDRKVTEMLDSLSNQLGGKKIEQLATLVAQRQNQGIYKNLECLHSKMLPKLLCIKEIEAARAALNALDSNQQANLQGKACKIAQLIGREDRTPLDCNKRAHLKRVKVPLESRAEEKRITPDKKFEQIVSSLSPVSAFINIIHPLIRE